MFFGTISGFARDDTIDAGVAANGYVFAGRVLTLSNSGTVAARLRLSTPITSPRFTLAGDGGSGTDITVHSAVVVSSGVTSSGITLQNGDTETVLSGGTASGTIIGSGGAETVSAGGNDFTATISGKQYVYGTATSATVASGGSQTVEPGGTASATTVSSGGRATVSSGGTAVDPVISGSGAVLDLLGGAIVSGGISFGGGGGELQIAGTTMPGNTISGFLPGDAIDLTSVAFDSLGSAVLGASNQLQITEGGTTYDLGLDPSQGLAGDHFHLASDGISGTLITESRTPPPDLNGDGKSDIVLENTSGDIVLWEMSGTTIAGGGEVANPGASWHYRGIGDFNGDGKSGILLQNDKSDIVLWEMDGATIAGGGEIAKPGPSWHYLPATGGSSSSGPAAAPAGPPASPSMHRTR